MGISADGRLCFGVRVSEESGDDVPEVPWSNHDDIEDWWREIKGFKHSFEPYDDRGNRKKGVGEAEINRYYSEKRDWDKANPLPVEEIEAGTYEYHSKILAVPGTKKEADLGEIVEINPAELVVPQEKIQVLLDFCQEYAVPFEGDPGWLLCSHYSE
jgi:hypothetical protein